MKLKKELPILIIAILPVLYLAYIYGDLPATVPIHWNAQGEIDGYGDKSTLWLVPFMMSVLTYILLCIAPFIDPKKQIERMGNKFHQFKFVIVLFMSVLAMYIINSSLTASLGSMTGLFILLGLLFAVIGNYMPSLKPNYFIGVRTPWTLESPVVWKKTHRLTGKLWVVAGVLLVLLALIIPAEIFLYIFIGITALITIVPLAMSYVWFKKGGENAISKE